MPNIVTRAANLEFKIPNPYNLELFYSVWNSNFGLEFSVLFGTFANSLEFLRYFGIFQKKFDCLSKSRNFSSLGHIKSVTRQLILYVYSMKRLPEVIFYLSPDLFNVHSHFHHSLIPAVDYQPPLIFRFRRYYNSFMRKMDLCG